MEYRNVQCCRCRHKHMENERLHVPSKKFSNATDSICPRCKCKTYYDLSPLVAWCWPSGLIEFGESAPEGSIVIATGPRSSLKSVVSVRARHGYDRSLLVPGVPEVDDEGSKSEALSAWLAWCSKANGKKSNDGVTFSGGPQ